MKTPQPLSSVQPPTIFFERVSNFCAPTFLYAYSSTPTMQMVYAYSMVCGIAHVYAHPRLLVLCMQGPCILIILLKKGFIYFYF